MIGEAFTLIVGKWQVSLAILAVLLLALGGAYLKGRADGRALERAASASAAGKAVVKGQEAGDAAHDTVTAGNATVAAQNDAARKAGDESDDPLKTSLDSLGKKK